MRQTAFFDKDGLCIVLSSGGAAPASWTTRAEVTGVSHPQEVWWDGSKVRTATKSKLKLPDVLDVDAAELNIVLPENVIAVVNGQRQQGILRISTDEPGHVAVDIRGAEYANLSVQIRSYIEHREAAYPPVAEQLDMIYHLGVDGWKAEIDKVKKKFPKQ